MVKVLLVGINAAFAVLASAEVVAAHGGGGSGGSGVVTAMGSFTLKPAGSQNDSFHAFLSSLRLPIGPGDILLYSWTANDGRGPPVYFEIHAHPATAGYVRFYNATSSYDRGSWSVPGSDTYMVYWKNPNAIVANVSYTFDLIPPPPEIWPLFLFPIAMGAIPLVWWLATRKARSRPR